MVQDVCLRRHRTDQSEVVDPRAFLVRITTKLCLDVIKSARRRRETYVGPQLPAPLIERLVDESTPAEEDIRGTRHEPGALRPHQRHAGLRHHRVTAEWTREGQE